MNQSKSSKKNNNYIQKQEGMKKSTAFAIFSIIAFSLTAIVFLANSFTNNSQKLSQTECDTQVKLNGTYKLLQRINRDNINNAQYTQGLMFKNETTLLESSGHYGKSSIHYLNLQNVDELLLNHKLPDDQFGEGCDIINNKVYQLTWLEKKIKIYNVDTLELEKEEKMPKQLQSGWGLTHRVYKGQIQILMTDGTHKVFITDENLSIKQQVPIFYQNQSKVNYLNELEYVNGILYANIYLSSNIVAIDLGQKKVIATYDFSQLVQDADRKDSSECLNGIAYNEKTKSFWITGKNWGFIQEVELY